MRNPAKIFKAGILPASVPSSHFRHDDKDSLSRIHIKYKHSARLVFLFSSSTVVKARAFVRYEECHSVSLPSPLLRGPSSGASSKAVL